MRSCPLWVYAAIIFPVVLFRVHIFGGGTWIGNPDRLNSNLKVLAFFLRSLANTGHFSAWNEHELLGYDSFTLPYTFPNPLVWISGIGGLQNLPITAGYISVALLILAGLSAGWFLSALSVAPLAAIVGVALYQMTALPILKVSQNDTSFAVFIVLPLMLRLIHNVSRSRLPAFFMALTALLFLMLHVMFLQKAAYALMLCSSYALWRSAARKSWLPVLYFGGATLVALVLASPRLIGIMIAMREYTRSSRSQSLASFHDVYQFQHIFPFQILRWLDPTLLGVLPSDPIALQNDINLTEGFLLGNSAAVPLLFLIGIIYGRHRWLPFLRRDNQDFAFWAWALAATVSVIVWQLPLQGLYYAFGQIDFTHARILIAGLPALVAAVCLLLTSYQPRGEMRLGVIAMGIALACIALFCIESHANHRAALIPTWIYDWDEKTSLVLRMEALLRTKYTILLCIGLLAGIFIFKRQAFQQIFYITFCAVVVLQTFLAADLQVNGPQTRNQAMPFNKGDMFMAHRDQFLLPSAQQISALSDRAKPDRQRVILICDPAVAGGFCAGHIPEAWQLRTADGYYGLGVPRRVRALPWSTEAGLRTVSFTTPQALDWPLLGLINVGGAMEITREFYENSAGPGKRADPGHIKIIPNPAHVVPRAFLARRIEPVASPEVAAKKIFHDDKVADVQQTSYVEGISAAKSFNASGAVEVQGANDQIAMDVSSTHGARFLVINELVFPGWHAFVDGQETPIYPTNAVMRGILLPETAKRVVLSYRPFVATRQAMMLYGLGILLLAAGIALCYRLRR